MELGKTLKKTCSSVLLFGAIFLMASNAMARSLPVVTQVPIILNNSLGEELGRVPQGSQLSSEKCVRGEQGKPDTCYVNYRLNGKLFRFWMGRLNLRLVERLVERPAPHRSHEVVRSTPVSYNRDVAQQQAGGNGGIRFASPTCSCAAGMCRVSSPFGPRSRPNARASANHQGQDIAGGAGTPIVASESGTIESASFSSGYGNHIIIDHGSGYTTLYGHMSRFVRTSGWVQKGETIGYMGSTGNVTGPHVHFEVRINGVRVNPAQYVGSSRTTFSQSCQSVRMAGMQAGANSEAIL